MFSDTMVTRGVHQLFERTREWEFEWRLPSQMWCQSATYCELDHAPHKALHCFVALLFLCFTIQLCVPYISIFLKIHGLCKKRGCPKCCLWSAEKLGLLLLKYSSGGFSEKLKDLKTYFDMLQQKTDNLQNTTFSILDSITLECLLESRKA